MADNRSRLEKLIGMMESDNDNEALVALRMVKKIAAEEKKNLRELLLTGQTSQARPHPKPSENPNYRHGQYGDFREAMRRAQEEAMRRAAREEEAARRAAETLRREREEQRRREQEQRQEARRRRYRGAFDDAEMSDAEREAARARRAARAEERSKRKTGDILKELQWAWDNGKDILNEFERVFVMDILEKYSDASELSYNQEVVAKRIIKLVKADMADNPI